MTLPDGTFTSTSDETDTILINHMIPHENPECTHLNTLMGQYQFRYSSNDELKGSIWKISPTKAPGKDLITAEIVREAWSMIEYTR